MSHYHEDIWKRTLPEVHHVTLCKIYHLKRFLRSARGRRERYFAAVADGHAILRRVLDCEPSEQDVLSWIAWVLGKDRTFLPYVAKHGGAAEALEPAKWFRVLQAGAGAILGEYLIALENGDLR